MKYRIKNNKDPLYSPVLKYRYVLGNDDDRYYSYWISSIEPIIVHDIFYNKKS